ncbi:MAG: hypothetical protein ACI9WV_001903 [Patiriisocius sp.]|jgi:hypothetical protein
MKTNIYSIRLTDKHTALLQASASLNKCSRAKVMEDALNKYYNINDVLERT